jgi:hypothetical protein
MRFEVGQAVSLRRAAGPPSPQTTRHFGLLLRLTLPFKLALLLLAAALLPAPAANADEETLRYNVNWPSGLSLGEGTLQTRRAADPPGAKHFMLTLDAAIPGITIRDEYAARATSDFCSIEFEKNSVHGPRKASEKSTFDAERRVLVRVTSAGGGKSEIPIASCAKDALTFLQFLRRELAHGRLPGAQTIYFGSAYQIRLTYVGPQNIAVGSERFEADRLTAAVKGPASEHSFEIWFARDAARTPLVIKVPFSLGTFSMELVR